MLGLTYFAARLRCPHCGTLSEDDTRTSMQNKLLDVTESVTFHVGNCIEGLSLSDFQAEFLTIRLPRLSEPIQLLHTWSCPTCGLSSWARVTFQAGKIMSIEDVGLSRKTIDNAHFIKDWVDEDYERYVGESMWTPEGVRPNFVETLKQHLPAS